MKDEATPSCNGRALFAAGRPQPSRGGGLRGLLWAVLLEAAALSLLAFLIYEWRALHL